MQALAWGCAPSIVAKGGKGILAPCSAGEERPHLPFERQTDLLTRQKVMYMGCEDYAERLVPASLCESALTRPPGSVKSARSGGDPPRFICHARWDVSGGLDG